MTEVDEKTSEKLAVEWREAARAVKTPEELVAFIQKLQGHQHDYGTIIHACAAAMSAALTVMDNGPQGGITGFQASAVWWVLGKSLVGLDGPAKLLRFENMLYPQYAREHEKVISADTWEWLQKEAKKNLGRGRFENVADSVKAHWKSIADGKVPFGYGVSDGI